MTDFRTPELSQEVLDLSDDLIEMIAKEQFTSVETLETRNSDSLDFHDVAVWQIKEALKIAFFAGVRYGYNVVGELK
jgi:hypothetical protein